VAVGRRLDRLVPLRFRVAALMPAAVLTVHQLRFQLAFGGQANAKLASEGHAYLGALAPLAAMLVAIAAGLFLARLALAARGDLSPGGDGLSFRRAWLIAAVALLAIYCAQELGEGLLISGHPGGLAGVFGEGGWLAVPLALALGAVVAAALRVSDAAVAWVASRAAARPAAATARPRAAVRPAPVFRFAPKPLAAAAAGRAPPAGPATSF
jgi:hypothetical protein